MHHHFPEILNPLVQGKRTSNEHLYKKMEVKGCGGKTSGFHNLRTFFQKRWGKTRRRFSLRSAGNSLLNKRYCFPKQRMPKNGYKTFVNVGTRHFSFQSRVEKSVQVTLQISLDSYDPLHFSKSLP